MPNGPGTDHIPPWKPLQPLNSGFLLPPLVNYYPLPYLRVLIIRSFIQFSSVAQLCPTHCNPMDCSTLGLPVHHQLPELAQTHVHQSGDAIQPSHLLSPTSPPTFNLSQCQVFSNESVLHIRWPKYWSFSISPSNEYSELISFRMDWSDILTVQRTLKSLPQHHSSKISIFQCSAFFIVQLSHPYMTTGKTITVTRQSFIKQYLTSVS